MYSYLKISYCIDQCSPSNSFSIFSLLTVNTRTQPAAPTPTIVSRNLHVFFDLLNLCARISTFLRSICICLIPIAGWDRRRNKLRQHCKMAPQLLLRLGSWRMPLHRGRQFPRLSQRTGMLQGRVRRSNFWTLPQSASESADNFSYWHRGIGFVVPGLFHQ